MKLIYCPACSDIVALRLRARVCACGGSGGQYEPDGNRAIVSGAAVPLGVDNHSFLDAVAHRPQDGEGAEFKAWIIPVKCSTVKAED